MPLRRLPEPARYGRQALEAALHAMNRRALNIGYTMAISYAAIISIRRPSTNETILACGVAAS